VLATITALHDAGLNRVWVSGGWGTDALEASQLSDHHDLDLVVDLDRLDEAVAVVGVMGFGLVEPPPGAPRRALALRDASGHELQLHPARFADDGAALLLGVQANGGGMPVAADAFMTGWVSGEAVPCLSPSVHVALHAHRTWDPALRRRLVRLGSRFGISLERFDRARDHHR
jgi:hypothetical protein